MQVYKTVNDITHWLPLHPTFYYWILGTPQANHFIKIMILHPRHGRHNHIAIHAVVTRFADGTCQKRWERRRESERQRLLLQGTRFFQTPSHNMYAPSFSSCSASRWIIYGILGRMFQSVFMELSISIIFPLCVWNSNFRLGFVSPSNAHLMCRRRERILLYRQVLITQPHLYCGIQSQMANNNEWWAAGCERRNDKRK